jgi:glucose/arabinose dehydrogenase
LRSAPLVEFKSLRGAPAFVFILILKLAVTIAMAQPSAAPSEKDMEALAARLTVPSGFRISLYAIGLGTARTMALTPKGDIILSAPPSKLLLIKKDNSRNDRPNAAIVLMDGLHKPSGLLLDGDQLYVAEEARVFRIGFDQEALKITGDPQTIIRKLPHGAGHFTRTIKKGPDGFLYATIGSSCDVCIESKAWRAAMIRFKPGEKPQLYASGLRNTVGFDWQPGSGDLYGVDNGRDWLGDELPPDEVNHIVQGGFYGWPYFYGDNRPDPDFGKRVGHRSKHAIPPAHKLPAHVAPLSILFLRHTKIAALGSAALLTEHGSWNRSRKIGYQVVALHWRNNEITEEPFLSGFLRGSRAVGRPVDIAEDQDGVIFVSDDMNGVIWRIAPSR